MLELKDFEAAYNKVQEVVLPTKLIKSDYFSDQTGNDVYLKPENMQLTGAYKIRGAYYKISTLSEEEKAKGLITASAGNPIVDIFTDLIRNITQFFCNILHKGKTFVEF